MAISLVDLVMRFLTPDIVGRIAAAVGIDRGRAQAAVDAAVPALLAGLARTASTPSGAQALATAAKQQTNAPDRFTSAIGTTEQSVLINQGTQLIASLLGPQDQSALTGAIAKFAGIGPTAASSVLGMVAPTVVGAIGKEFGPRGPNASGIIDLFNEQIDEIAAAIPAGLGNLLSGTKILDAVTGVTSIGAAAMDAGDGAAMGMGGQATHASGAATGDAGRYAYSAARNVEAAREAARNAGSEGWQATGRGTSGLPNWAYWAIPLAVIIGVGAYVIGNMPATRQFASTAPLTAPNTPQINPPAAPSIVAAIDINNQLGQSLGTLRTSLQGITDPASARAALPKLQQTSAAVDKVSAMVGQLTHDQRRLIGFDSNAMAMTNQMFDRVLAIPGVSEVLKPTLDDLRTKLATISA